MTEPLAIVPPNNPSLIPHKTTHYSHNPSSEVNITPSAPSALLTHTHSTNTPTTPLPSSLSSFNVTSTSQYTSNRLTKSRRIQQETKLAARQEGRLTANHTNTHTAFYSNNPNNSFLDASHNTAGIATTIATSYPTLFHHSTYQLDPSLLGHALLVLLTHRTTGHIIALLNIRLHSSNPNTRNNQLRSIFLNRNFPFPAHHFLLLGGDFNFNESRQDSSHLASPHVPGDWPLILSLFHLHEIKQDLPTFLSISAPSSNSPSKFPRIVTSRIDRFYLSLTESHYSSHHPTVKVLPVKPKPGFSNHLPISLSLTPVPAHHAQRRPSIPPWIIAHKQFTTIFHSIYIDPPLEPFLRLQFFKTCLYRTKKRILILTQKSTDKLHQLQVCVKALRYTQTETSRRNATEPATNSMAPTSHPAPPSPVICTADRIRFLSRSYAPLLQLVRQRDDLSWDTSRLISHINHIYSTEGELDPCNGKRPGQVNPLLQPFDPLHKPPCLARTLKILLPSSRSRTTHLRDTLDPSFDSAQPHNFHNAPLTDNPDNLSTLISAYWGKLWSHPVWPDPRSRHKDIHTYLRNYNKQLDTNLVKPISIEIVLQALAHTGNSAVGPDGIPFAAYRTLAEVAGPLLYDLALLLGTPKPRTPNFNLALLLLLPKDDTQLIDHQRPLGINNTDNRILSNVFLLCILEAVQKLIDPAQKMFLPNRQMTDHIRQFNDLFYTAAHEDLDFFILFCDNTKAFDSMFHDFIHAVLQKQGFPCWFLHVIKNLLSDIKLIPTLSPDSRIPFFKGVKQGCPLSPVLFILIYDVRITYLQQVAPPNTWVAGAADDLALASRSLVNILPF